MVEVVKNIPQFIEELVKKSLLDLGFEITNFKVEKTKNKAYGDYSVNVAMVIAQKTKTKPREIAEKILTKIQIDSFYFENIKIEGPGFINFYISNKYYKENLKRIIKLKELYGNSNRNSGKTVNIEWVSANPTGPLHAGHGRQICLGKAIANLLEATGFTVVREYYFNDAGNQMILLAKSIYSRYMQIFEKDFPFPEYGYKGEYINDIANYIFREYGNKLKNNNDLSFFLEKGKEYNFKAIKNTLEQIGIKHDIFFNESELYENNKINDLLNVFEGKGLLKKENGAIWLKMSDFGFEKDKVLVKSTGEPTYRLPDMAYHIEKIKRGYDLIIDIFGSDHSDTYKEVLFGIKSAGYDISNIKVIIHQMVTFRIGEKSVKMSKRSDDVYYLDDLIRDVGKDAVQFFFIMRAPNTHLDFDISLAKEQSERNPVYYLQYAHARICGIIRNSSISDIDINIDNINLDLLIENEELEIINLISQFPEEIENCANTFEPHKLIVYLNKNAEVFHRFYHNHRVLNCGDEALEKARLALCFSVKQVLKNGLNVLGVTAPERM